jgi:alkylation response protein AidB-like acyl-CoA dehydrogenase
MRLWCLRTVNGWNGARARAEIEQGSSSPVASLGKLAMSQILHYAASVQAEILGAEAMLGGAQHPIAADNTYALLNAFFTSIGGGTDQIQRNIIGERILGLPKEPEVDKNVPFREVRKATVA